MFEGWDADVILLEYKIAVNWNGIWHYKPIRKGMDIEKTRQRDLLKDEAIIRCGFLPYTIKDMGKHNKECVKKEFDTFVNFVQFNQIES